MNKDERMAISRAILNVPIPPDSMRIQVWRTADGNIDGCSTISVKKMTPTDGVAFMVKLRSIVETMENNMVEHLAQRNGYDAGELRRIIAETVRDCPACDSITMVRECEQ